MRAGASDVDGALSFQQVASDALCSAVLKLMNEIPEQEFTEVPLRRTYDNRVPRGMGFRPCVGC